MPGWVTNMGVDHSHERFTIRVLFPEAKGKIPGELDKLMDSMAYDLVGKAYEMLKGDGGFLRKVRHDFQWARNGFIVATDGNYFIIQNMRTSYEDTWYDQRVLIKVITNNSQWALRALSVTMDMVKNHEHPPLESRISVNDTRDAINIDLHILVKRPNEVNQGNNRGS